jgi:hypothetical protein
MERSTLRVSTVAIVYCRSASWASNPPCPRGSASRTGAGFRSPYSKVSNNSQRAVRFLPNTKVRVERHSYENMGERRLLLINDLVLNESHGLFAAAVCVRSLPKIDLWGSRMHPISLLPDLFIYFPMPATFVPLPSPTEGEVNYNATHLSTRPALQLRLNNLWGVCSAAHPTRSLHSYRR